MTRPIPACQRHSQDIPAWVRDGVSISEIARRIGTNKTRVRLWLRARGIAVPRWDNKGPRNGRWKGGRVIDKDGYALLKRPDHPNRSRHGYVREHRLVMEATLGRFLGPTEVVHHKDGDKLNNSPGNLQVFGSNAEHLGDTLRGRRPNWTEEGLRRMQEAAARNGARLRGTTKKA